MLQHILFALARLFIRAVGLLPHRLVLASGAALGRLAFHILHSRRQVALDNLQLIYGDKLEPAARIKMARDNFAHLGGAALEVMYAAGCSIRRQEKLYRLTGEKNLTALLAQGRGGVLFSGHLGNFYIMGMAMAKLCNVKFIFREPSHPLAARIYLWIIKRLGIGVIADNPRNQCAMKCFLHLRSQNILGVLIDQVETGGAYVDFMGKPAGTILGAANMALKMNAPLLPVHCYRQADNVLQVEIMPEFIIRREGRLEDLLIPAVAAMNKVVGDWVFCNPTQWFWGHRRWRRWKK
ncbi:hypothetical protein JW933_05730 [candidate division FCPU426 bacterium]|nr:hypothetical protein [candidate division FCPU426 bacterium]